MSDYVGTWFLSRETSDTLDKKLHILCKNEEKCSKEELTGRYRAHYLKLLQETEEAMLKDFLMSVNLQLPFRYREEMISYLNKQYRELSDAEKEQILAALSARLEFKYAVDMENAVWVQFDAVCVALRPVYIDKYCKYLDSITYSEGEKIYNDALQLCFNKEKDCWMDEEGKENHRYDFYRPSLLAAGAA